jgi:hypothetical protein
MMYMNLCILACMHFVSYALVRKSFSYIHRSAWNDMYVFVSFFGKIWLVWLSSFDNLGLYPWLMAMFFKTVTCLLSCEYMPLHDLDMF